MNTLDELLDLNFVLNNVYDYGIIRDGLRLVNIDFDYGSYYRTMSPEDFALFKIGICWDFAIYQCKWFHDNGYKYESYYVEEPGENHTHALTLVYIDGSDKVYYFEASWYPYGGVHEYDSITEALDSIREFFNENAPKCCRIYKVDFLDGFSNLSVEEFMSKARTGKLVYEFGQYF